VSRLEHRGHVRSRQLPRMNAPFALRVVADLAHRVPRNAILFGGSHHFAHTARKRA
jgi:hypothetical protein